MAFVQELIPAPDPWETAQRFADWPGLLFFDSAERATERGRYSYVTAEPRAWLLERVDESADLWTALAALLGPRRESRPDLPPFQGGVAGLFGYGLGRSIEHLPPPEFDEFRLPDLAIGRYDWVISFDHRLGRAWFVSHVEAEVNSAALGRLAGSARLHSDSSRASLPIELTAPSRPLAGYPAVLSNFSRAEYETAVSRAIEYIEAGDCFQVNLSQRLATPLTEPPLWLYGRLRRCNPAPFGGYFDFGLGQILSVSPEQFLKLRPDGEVVTRPIKGTRRRGSTPEEDFALCEDLRTSDKDRAENIMIVDLLRNDLSRVCAYGSVVAPTLCERETHPTVHHLVSEVRGRLRPECGPMELLRAAFPGGSVTGAPKIRAMEVITELERVARGAYCGSLGWIGFDGAMDTSILIRTLTAAGGWLVFPVGGGIVADSEPAREYEETLHKAAGMLRALVESDSPRRYGDRRQYPANIG
jgi:para-aminobenzoate synthetase component 1